MSAVPPAYPSPLLTVEELADVARAVFSTLLGVQVHHTEGVQPWDGTAMVRAGVQLSGSLDACLAIEVAESTGRALAALMFGTAPGELSDEETADALGELANVVGGNLKAVLSPPATLSLPFVEGLPGQSGGPGRPPSRGFPDLALYRVPLRADGLAAVQVVVYTSPDQLDHPIDSPSWSNP